MSAPKHISRVAPGEYVRRKSDGTIHTVANIDPGACQLRVSPAAIDVDDPEYAEKIAHLARNSTGGHHLTALESWDLFEPHEPTKGEPDPFTKETA